MPVLCEMRNRQGPPEPLTLEQAWTKALRWLALRSLSTREVTERLERSGATEDVVAQVIERLLDSGYLNDRRFAESYARYRQETSSHGSRRVTYDLMRKGISAEEAGNVVHSLLSTEEEHRRAYRLAQRQLQHLQSGDRTDRLRERLCAFLQRKGYPVDVILAVTEELIRSSLCEDAWEDSVT